MNWKVKFSRKAEKQLDNLENKHQISALEILTTLQEDPKSLPVKTMKKLVNKSGYRIRVGDLRLKVKFSGDTIEVFFVGLKNDNTY